MQGTKINGITRIDEVLRKRCFTLVTPPFNQNILKKLGSQINLSRYIS